MVRRVNNASLLIFLIPPNNTDELSQINASKVLFVFAFIQFQEPIKLASYLVILDNVLFGAYLSTDMAKVEAAKTPKKPAIRPESSFPRSRFVILDLS